MGASRVALGALTSITGSIGNPTLAEPVGVGKGDLLILCATWRANAPLFPPSGWTSLVNNDTGDSNGTEETTTAKNSFLMAAIQRGSSPPDLVVTGGGSGRFLGRIIAFRGLPAGVLDTAEVVSRRLTAASVTVVTTTGFTTVEAQELLVMLAANARNDLCSNEKANTDPTAGWTEDCDDATDRHGLAIAHVIKSSVGATGTLQYTAGTAALHGIAVLLIRSALSVAIAPNSASAVGARVMPSVLAGGLSITPDAATARGQVVAPTVRLGSLSIAPANANAKVASVAPTIGVGVEVMPAPAEVKAEASIEDILEDLGPIFGPQDPLAGFWTPEVPLE